MPEIEKSETFSGMLAAVKSAGNGIVKPFLPGTSADGTTPQKTAFKSAMTSAKATAASALSMWLPLSLSLVAAAAAYYFLIFKKRTRRTRRRR